MPPTFRALGFSGRWLENKHSETSNLELLASFDEPVSLFDIFRLKQELGSQLGVEVDVVTEGSLKSRIGERVAADLVEV